MSINYESARKSLEEAFLRVESDMVEGLRPGVDQQFSDACDVLFVSHTQAYREVLLGCILGRIQDKTINIRQPYVNQGPNAFSGRSLDEKVVIHSSKKD